MEPNWKILDKNHSIQILILFLGSWKITSMLFAAFPLPLISKMIWFTILKLYFFFASLAKEQPLLTLKMWLEE